MITSSQIEKGVCKRENQGIPYFKANQSIHNPIRATLRQPTSFLALCKQIKTDHCPMHGVRSQSSSRRQGHMRDRSPS